MTSFGEVDYGGALRELKICFGIVRALLNFDYGVKENFPS